MFERFMCNNNVFYYFYIYFTIQIIGNQNRAVDKTQSYESRRQWFESQAG